MPVPTFVQPDRTTQSGAAYPASIDAAIAVLVNPAGHFAAHEQSAPNMTVRVDAGKLQVGTGVTVLGVQNTAAIVAPTTNPRIDRVVIDSITGVVSVITGVEAASPTAPAITAGKLAVAQVSLATTTTTITNSLLTDERTFGAGLGANTFTGTQIIENTAPILEFKESGAALDNARWQLYVDGEIFRIRLSNDSGSAGDNAIFIDRTGVTIDSITLNGRAILSTGQLSFPATANPNADPNTLDDYEEGTWTPTLGGTATYTQQAGHYTKVGRLVTFSWDLQVNTIGTGDVDQIFGLPFAAGGGALDSHICSVMVNNNSATAITSVVGVISATATNVLLRSRTAASTSDLNNPIFGNSTDSSGSGHYHI